MLWYSLQKVIIAQNCLDQWYHPVVDGANEILDVCTYPIQYDVSH